MLNWHPVIAGLPIPQPRTEFVLSKENWWQYLDGIQLPEDDMMILKAAIAKMGYPVFLRTDLASGKHHFLDASYIGSEDRIAQTTFSLIEQNALRDLWFDSLVVREFLELDYRFKAFDGLPIAREKRYFVRDGAVICHHAYWVQEAIQFYRRSQEWEATDWRQSLRELNTESDAEITLLTGYAQMVASALPGSWSIDFAMTKDGKWYLIDCAEAGHSWHPPCENKLTDNQKGS
nr:MAG: ATP-grasp domain-containing protein [Candidatus Methanoperedens sp.]